MLWQYVFFSVSTTAVACIRFFLRLPFVCAAPVRC